MRIIKKFISLELQGVTIVSRTIWFKKDYAVARILLM